MSKMKLLNVLLFFNTLILLSQENIHYDLIYESLERQIEYELKTTNITQRNVYLLDTPISYSETNGFYEIKDIIVKDVKINFLSSKEIKKKSRKGISILRVYPYRIDNDTGQLMLLIETVNAKKRRRTLVGKNSYYFRFNCDTQKYILDKENHDMI